MQEVQEQQYTGFWSGQSEVKMFDYFQQEQVLVFKSEQAFNQAKIEYWARHKQKPMSVIILMSSL